MWVPAGTGSPARGLARGTHAAAAPLAGIPLVGGFAGAGLWKWKLQSEITVGTCAEHTEELQTDAHRNQRCFPGPVQAREWGLQGSVPRRGEAPRWPLRPSRAGLSELSVRLQR